MHTVKVGDLIKVEWSNDSGYSMFRVVDNPGNGPHQFVLVEEFEVCGNGEFVKMNNMQHFIHKEPVWVENLSPSEAAAIQQIYAKAHVEGVWEMVYCSEGTNARGVGALAYALDRTGTEFHIDTDNGYVCGTWGKGWVNWGFGCSGASAICILFMDQSLMETDYAI